MRSSKKSGKLTTKDARHEAQQPRAHDELIKVGNRFSQCRIRNEPGGGYTVACQGLARRIFGKTLADARTNAEEMMTLWLDALDEAERRAPQSHGPDQ